MRVLDRLIDEHKTIRAVIDHVDRALVEFVSHLDGFTGLQQSIDVLSDALLSHVVCEEYQLVEPLARLGFYADQI